VNYLALLGWSLDGKTDLIPRADLVKHFSLERVNKSPATFDYQKLLWVDGNYIRKADDEVVFQQCLEYLWDMGGIDEDFMRSSGAALKRMLGLVKSSLKTINEVGDQILYFLGEVHVYDPVGLDKHLTAANLPILEEAVKILDDQVMFSAPVLENKFREAAAASGRKFADYVHPVRLAVTGRVSSPSLFEVIEILGKGRCIVRLKRFIQMIKAKA
jgi:glutamyl/glutaminyl-tRNA synthetase